MLFRKVIEESVEAVLRFILQLYLKHPQTHR